MTVIAAAGSSSPLIGVTAIATGEGHSCALLATSTIKCWGTNFDGFLGDGTATRRLAPVTVIAASGSANPLSGVAAITAGGDNPHTCALLAAGGVRCWGNNAWGQLGDGTTTTRYAPVIVKAAIGSSSALSGVTAIASGYQHTCALLVSGTQKCWGVDNIGTLGDGTMQTGLPPNIRLAPVTVIAAEGIASPLTGIGQRAIVAGFGQSCVLLVNGTVKVLGSEPQWRGRGRDDQPALDSGHRQGGRGRALSNVVAIAAGGFYTCALLSNGTVTCWGSELRSDAGQRQVRSRAAAPPCRTSSRSPRAPTTPAR